LAEPPEAVDRHVAILATAGAGKTYAAKGAVEQLLDAGRRVCIIDPTGVWYGLRLKPNGKTPSPYGVVIFGGDHADVPLDAHAGARLADLVAAGDFSCIIDVKRMTVRARTTLFADFAERLAQVNSRALWLVIDEAHLFAPQGRVYDPESGRMTAATNNLVAGGRALGVRVMLISHRPAKLHKDSLTLVQTLVAMQNVAPQDRAAVKAWIVESADKVIGERILASLPSLQPGFGWVWSPRLGILSEVHFRPIATFDSSATPDHDDARPAVRLAALDLGALRAALAAPEEAAPSAKPPAKAVAKAGPSPAEIDARLKEAEAAAERAGYLRGFKAGARKEQAFWFVELEKRLLAALAGVFNEAANDRIRADDGDVIVPPPSTSGVEAAAPSAPRQFDPDGPLGGGAKRLLEAISHAPARETLTWNEAALLAGVSPTAGYTRAARAELRARQLVAETARGDIVRADVEYAGEARADELVEEWAKKLGGGAARILRHLYLAGRQPRTSVSATIGISDTAGYTRAGWAKLRNFGLIDQTPEGWDLVPLLLELKALQTQGRP
jgi:hypothetical protein